MSAPTTFAVMKSAKLGRVNDERSTREPRDAMAGIFAESYGPFSGADDAEVLDDYVPDVIELTN